MQRAFARIICVALVILIIFAAVGCGELPASTDPETTTYFCNVRHFTFNTYMDISCDGKAVGVISGNIFTWMTDPLQLTRDGNKVGYAADDYQIFGQDNHAIIVEDKMVFYMEGGQDWIGDDYKLRDPNGEAIAEIHFNALNTGGILYDMNGSKIAEYSSSFIRDDFNVIIYDTDLNHDALLLLFASYWSDQHFDSEG